MKAAGRRRQKNREPARNYFPIMLKIRRYRPDDNKAVKELHHTGNEQMFQMMTEAEQRELREAPPMPHGTDLDDIEGEYLNNRGDFLVGLEDSQIVAMGAIKKYTETSGELKRLRVRPDRQRQGYGEVMMKRLEERGKELGYKTLVLDTLASNTTAQSLFRKLGFAEVGREKRGPFSLSSWEKKIGEGK
jgi:ribosomal protein S18 acetylase RimI-like enzyme